MVDTKYMKKSMACLEMYLWKKALVRFVDVLGG